MRLPAALLTVIGYFIFLSSDTVAKPWRGIVPLQSTRADVERILGKPTIDRDIYDSPEGRAIISYSTGKACEEDVPGLGSIPPDVVIEISISLTRNLKLSDVRVPGREYREVRAVHTPTTYYVDREEGVSFTVQDPIEPIENEATVWSIRYFGSRLDAQRFSCGEYKYAAPIPRNVKPIAIEQYPYDSYGKIPSDYVKARLDNFVIQLIQSNEKEYKYRGFIIVYAGRLAYPNEAKLVAECTKNYLVKIRGANPESIVAVDGGYQDKFLVELYLFPIDSYPPMLLPTVSPRKVQLQKGCFKPCK